MTSKTATAEDYTLTPVEADLDKPYWDRANSAGGTMGNPKVTYEDPDDDTDPDEDTYYNFALVYTDGEVSGKVNNLSTPDNMGASTSSSAAPARWTTTKRSRPAAAATSGLAASWRRSAIRP